MPGSAVAPRNPIRAILPDCCASAVSGQPVALAGPAMNARRRILHTPEPLCGQPIAARVGWERVKTEAKTEDCRPHF